MFDRPLNTSYSKLVKTCLLSPTVTLILKNGVCSKSTQIRPMLLSDISQIISWANQLSGVCTMVTLVEKMLEV